MQLPDELTWSEMKQAISALRNYVQLVRGTDTKPGLSEKLDLATAELDKASKRLELAFSERDAAEHEAIIEALAQKVSQRVADPDITGPLLQTLAEHSSKQGRDYARLMLNALKNNQQTKLKEELQAAEQANKKLFLLASFLAGISISLLGVISFLIFYP